MDESLAALIQHFSAVLNPDEQIRGPANAALIELIKTDPFNFIYLSSQILKLDELQTQIYQMSIICIGRAFTPTVLVPVDLMAQKFLNPENNVQRMTIKEAIFRCLMFDNQIIRLQASYCITILLQIEKDGWADLLPALFELAASDKYPMCAHSGAIHCFSQLINPQIPLAFLSGIMPNFFDLVTSYLNIPDKVPGDLYSECWECYLSILKSLFDEKAITDEMIQQYFTLVNKKFEVLGIADTKFALDSLFIIFKSIYQTSILTYIQPLLSITEAILQNGPFDEQMSAINLWTKIAKYEYSIPEDDRKNVIANISASFFPYLTKAIIVDFHEEETLQEMIDMNSPEYEETEAHRYGHKCLSKFYLAAPEAVAEHVLKLWQESFDTPENQIIALISLTSILKRKCRYPPIDEFIEDESNKQMILSLLSSENPIVSIFAFKLIRKAIRVFSSFIRNDAEIAALMAALHESTEKNIALIPYACKIIEAIGYAYNDSTKITPCLFNENNFAQYWELINSFLSKTQTIRIFLYSIDALTLLVSGVPAAKIELLAPVLEMFKTTIINTLPQSSFPPETQSSIQSSLLYLLPRVLGRLAALKIDIPDIEYIIKILFALSQKPEIYDDVLSSFSAIIRVLKENYAPYISATMDMILNMLKTNNSNTIKNSCHVLSELFLNVPEMMIEFADPVFKFLVQLLSNEITDKEMIFDVMTTLGDITKKVPVPVECKQKLFEIAQNLRNTLSIPIRSDVSKEERIIVLKYFQAVFYDIREIILTSLSDPESEITSINYKATFEPLIYSFMSLDLSFLDDETFDMFLTFLESLADLYHNQAIAIISLNNKTIRSYLSSANKYFGPNTCALLKKTMAKLADI